MFIINVLVKREPASPVISGMILFCKSKRDSKRVSFKTCLIAMPIIISHSKDRITEPICQKPADCNYNKDQGFTCTQENYSLVIMEMIKLLLY